MLTSNSLVYGAGLIWFELSFGPFNYFALYLFIKFMTCFVFNVTYSMYLCKLPKNLWQFLILYPRLHTVENERHDIDMNI